LKQKLFFLFLLFYIAQIKGEFINGIDYLRKCVFVGILQDAPIAQIKGEFINGIDYLRKWL